MVGENGVRTAKRRKGFNPTKIKGLAINVLFPTTGTITAGLFRGVKQVIVWNARKKDPSCQP